MKATLFRLFYFPGFLLLFVVSFVLVSSKTYAQSCKLNDIAMYGWMGDSDGHTASTNIDNSTTDDEDGDDWISFVNRGTSNVDISGWQLYTDQFYKRRSNSFATAAFTFPAGTVLSPGQKVFVIGQWDGGSIRDGWYNANFNEGGEGLFEEVSNNDAWAILKNPATNNYITIHQQGLSSAGMSLPSPAVKVCNVNVTNFITNDFEGCEVILLNEATGAYYEQTNCSYASYPDSDGDGTPDLQDDDIDDDGIINSQDKFPNDTDNDGISNPSDTDKDGDGILDTNEASGKILDTDNDGTPNKTDTDDDNDGLLDTAEIGVLDSNGKYTLPDSDGDNLPDLADPLDTDGDGIPNHIDLDDDNDGILDTVEGNLDADGDGTVNRLDLDSDNDGINDVIEGGGSDADGDGHPGPSPVVVDASGIPTAAAGGLTPKNTDGDSAADYLDLDSDNDGINDIVESGNSAAIAADANNDGKIDFTSSAASDADHDGIIGVADGKPTWGDAAGTGSVAADTDGDGVPNFRDLDSDNDGIKDAVEGSIDTDGDGAANYIDLDSDNDSISDLQESGNPGISADTNNDGTVQDSESAVGINGIPLSLEGTTEGGTVPTPKNTDGDSLPDYIDPRSNASVDDIDGTTHSALDANNDGKIDTVADVDKDGIADAVDANTNVFGGLAKVVSKDSDGDGIIDTADLDDDNDGILDSVEGDSDTDGDGVINRLDLDSDNDGINDVIEAGGADADGDGHPGNSPVTVDSNGVPTAAAGGLTPKNSDGDGVADYLDLDSDNDGINDIVESGNSAVIAADTNKDGKIDFTSTTASDADGDGIVGAADGKPTWGDAAGTGSALADTDGDGVPDFRDLDSDNDGNTDVRENGGTDTDGNGQADGADTDGDGIPSTADGSPTTWGDSADPALVDTDGDGIPNTKDLDSDDDGVNDVNEAGLTDTNGDGQADGNDTDGDGIPATADGSPTTWGDASDPSMPAAVTTPNGTPNTGPDTDGDGIKDSVDGAPTVWGDLASATDLRPFIILQDANFVTSSLTKNFSVRVSNLTTGTTTNPATPIVISISKTSDYSVVLTGAAGNNWTLENLDAFTIVLTSKANLTVTSGTQAEITMAITALSTTSFGTTNIIVNIEDGSGGETNNLNNSASRNLIRN